MLQVNDLRIGYTAPKVVVADGISVSLRAGEMVCLLGPNGAGKSTLMRTLAGMQSALSGEVLIDGEDVHQMPVRRRARHLAVVLTEKLPTGLLSSQDLVALGRYPHTPWWGRLREADHEAVRWALSTVGAEEFANRPVCDLSDGERQKVMIARALAQEPRVLILDEITAFLDLPRRVEVMRLLRHLARATDRAILVSTHDLDLALRSADRLWLLPKGDATGEAVFAGAPEDLVLSGAFERTFATEGVAFDRGAGAFHIHRDHRGEIEVRGDGLELFWTRRALERLGLKVLERTPGTPGARIDIENENGGARWLLSCSGKTRAYGSLYDLSLFLRERIRTGPRLNPDGEST